MKRAKKPSRSHLNAQLPEIFIASSGKSVEIAYDVQQNLEDDADATVWKQGVFEPSTFTLDQIVNALNQCDYGIFIFAPDDVAKINGKTFRAVRDNVLFELGLFIGRLGRERCFIIVPKASNDLRLPTDLAGLTTLPYKASRLNRTAALGPACNAIRKAINKLGFARNQKGWIKVKRPAPWVSKKIPVNKLPKRSLAYSKSKRASRG